MSAAEKRNPKARQKARIEAALPLAASLAARRCKLSGGLELEDLKQIAYLALVRAAERFEPDRGASFTTFAHSRIAGALKDAISEQVACQRATVSLSARPDTEEPNTQFDDYDTAALADYRGEPGELIDCDDLSGRPVPQARTPDLLIGEPVLRDPYLMRRASDFPQAKLVLHRLVRRRAKEAQRHG